ncbi:GlxA family transcriptional regulator [Sagittula sp. S175]|uniref:GlxA family transcriptional regulator n=1 Tax=Sagittula sp. S175 TaxID=3415129 RepID=UPI003C7BC1DC
MDIARHIDVLLFDDLNILDVAGPVQAFVATNHGGVSRYELRYVSLDGRAVTTSCGLRLQPEDRLDPEADRDLLIPGGPGVDRMLLDENLRKILMSWPNAANDRRLISICSGALILAAAGILDGRIATTHWGRKAQVLSHFPAVSWLTDALYHIDDPIFTSAGVTSGIDLSLEMIRRDHGAAVALSVARELVVYLRRSGGQSQFTDILEAQFTDDPALSRLISALHDTPGADWTLDRMADVAGLTSRTLVRRFSAKTGQTLVKFLERYRVKRASDALSGGLPVGQSIEVAGFTDFQQMQRAFKRHLGTTVGSYVDNFAT